MGGVSVALFAILKLSGLYSNRIIVLTSDHGDWLGCPIA